MGDAALLRSDSGACFNVKEAKSCVCPEAGFRVKPAAAVAAAGKNGSTGCWIHCLWHRPTLTDVNETPGTLHISNQPFVIAKPSQEVVENEHPRW